MLTHKVVTGKNEVNGCKISFILADIGFNYYDDNGVVWRYLTSYNEHENDKSETHAEVIEGLTSYYKEWGYDVTFTWL